MSNARQARDTSHVQVEKLSRGLRADWPLRELRRFPLLLNRGCDLSCHLPHMRKRDVSKLRDVL